MSVEIEFVESLPAARYVGRPESEVKAALRAHPGQWGIVRRARSGGANLRKVDGFEVRTRKQDDGTVITYARYVGAAS